MARKKKKKPVSLSKISVGVATVENPDWRPDRDGEKAFPRLVSVPINSKESAIAVLAARKDKDGNRLINDSQMQAADAFRRHWERLGGKGASAMDYSRVVVDGGPIADPINPGQIEAGKQLHKAFKALTAEHGLYSYRLVGYVVGDGCSIHDLAQTRRQRDTLTDNLRTYLDCLAECWGFSKPAEVMDRRPGKIRSMHYP
jgi:hypothetical protein